MSLSGNRAIDFSIVERIGGKTERYRAGSEIMREGEPRTQMFYLHKGKAAVLTKGREIEEVAEGGIFGEMAMIETGGRSGDEVIALSYCKLLVLHHDDMRTMFATQPAIREKIWKVARERRQMNQVG